MISDEEDNYEDEYWCTSGSNPRRVKNSLYRQAEEFMRSQQVEKNNREAGQNNVSMTDSLMLKKQRKTLSGTVEDLDLDLDTLRTSKPYSREQ